MPRFWRSQGNSNPCFRRERATTTVQNGPILIHLNHLILLILSARQCPYRSDVDRLIPPPYTGHKLDTGLLRIGWHGNIRSNQIETRTNRLKLPIAKKACLLSESDPGISLGLSPE